MKNVEFPNSSHKLMSIKITHEKLFVQFQAQERDESELKSSIILSFEPFQLFQTYFNLIREKYGAENFIK